MLLETVCWNDNGTHMHHSWVTLPIVSVEKVEHILLKLFTVSVDGFSCLLRYQLPVHTLVKYSPPCLR